MSTRSLGLSAALHVLVFLLVVFGLPYFSTPPLMEPQVITVELLPISNKSNAPNMRKAPKPKKDLPKQEEKPKKEEVKPTPKKEPVKKPEPKKPEPKKEEKKPEPIPEKEPVKKEEKKPEKKPEPKKEAKEEKKKEEPKKDETSFDELLKNLEKETPKPEEKTEKSDSSSPATPDSAPVVEGDKDIKSDQFDPSAQISMSEKDAIRNQIMKCWSPPLGAKDAGNLIPILKVKYRVDGSVENVYLSASQGGRYNSEPAFKAAADSAIRAVRACSPLKDVLPEKYQGWKDIELTFDPRNLL